MLGVRDEASVSSSVRRSYPNFPGSHDAAQTALLLTGTRSLIALLRLFSPQFGPVVLVVCVTNRWGCLTDPHQLTGQIATV